MAIRHVLLGAAAAAFVTVVATATPSLAQPTYPPTGPSATVSATVVTAGQSVTVAGTGYLPNSTVTITTFVGRSAGTRGAATQGAATQGAATQGAATQSAATAQQPQARAMTGAVTGAGPQRVDLAQGVVTKGYGHGPVAGCATGRTCQVQVNAQGEFSATVTLTRPGLNAIWIVGRDTQGARSDITLTVQVLARPGRPGRHHHHHGHHGAAGTNYSGGGKGGAFHGGLAMTGTPVTGELVGGAVMLLAGSGLLLGVRRRRRRASA